MKPSTLIVWLLIAACIAIDLAMIGELQVRRNEWPEAGGVIGLGLVFSQVALIALWTVWGRSHVLVRGVGTLLAIWAVSGLASYSQFGGWAGVSRWFGVLLLYCGVALFLFIVARFANYELSKQDAAKPQTTKRHLSSNQFTIWGLLSLMTAVGISLTAARFADFPMRQLVEAVAFFSLLAATVCTIILLALSLSKVRGAVIGAIVICPTAGFLLSLTALATGAGRLELTLLMCVQGVASLSAAVALRTAGFRLVRRTAPCEATASKSPAVSTSVSADQRDEP
ncbi:MAG: hypothetical protein O3C40_23075 [Planctomycetota bacterium]|nr:hypothetical protein [Planctomycetota bacterium]